MITYILFALVFILLFLIAFKIVKKLIKALITAIIIFLIIFSILGIIIYIDAKSLTQAIQGPKEIYVLSQGDFQVGTYLKTDEITPEDVINMNFFEHYTLEELNLAEKEYLVPKPKKEKRIVLIIEKDYLLKDQTLLLKEQNIELSEDSMTQLFSSNSLEEAANIISADNDYDKEQTLSLLNEEYKDLNELNTIIMLKLLSNQRKENKKYLIEGITNEEIFIIPEFMSIKLINYIPKSIANKIV